jgi:hypothetical protein
MTFFRAAGLAVPDGVGDSDDGDGSMESVAWMFLALLSRKTGVSFFLSRTVMQKVAAVLQAHAMTTTTTTSPEGEEGESTLLGAGDVPWLIGHVAAVDELRAIHVDGLHSTMWACLAAALHSPARALELLADVSSPAPPPLHWGRVRRDMANAFTLDSRFGAVQIGSPPETIKGSLERGHVPHIFVLPHRLFTSGVNFGEVEFPIFFAYYISVKRG